MTPRPDKPAESVQASRSPWLRPNVFTGVVGAVIGFIIGVWIGHRVGTHLDWVSAIDQNDVSVFAGYSFGTIGFLAGLGLLNYPALRLIGLVPAESETASAIDAAREHDRELADAEEASWRVSPTPTSRKKRPTKRRAR